ncbi:E3 SUMO-protein ligase ZBED1-like [Daktulosphaira vitifoliae]|uniref:E3 SUMO-protein ligase ZBED1-like n=1 Tax=Daktulosphaira vitifoliae TaxID=58002 RepID=UPI0021AB0A38|nr:E3 SUMO-protein ligase ZBED1-like [Daktulosphaira vitifoliae]
MLERLLMIKEPLMLVSMSLPRCPNMPTNEQWKVINDFVALLKPYESLTLQLSSEKRPTLGKVIPLIRGLLLTVGNKNPATSPGNYLKKNLLEQTTKRFGDIQGKYPSHLYSKATILSPRFKKAAFTSIDNANEAEQELLKDLTEYLENHGPLRTEQIIPESTISESNTKLNSIPEENLLNFLETTVSTLRSQTTFSITAKALCRQYFDVEFLNITDNPILFWKNNNLMFGALSEIALKYLCIPATSVPSERIFSKAGQIVSIRRNRLLPKNVDKLLFLNSNSEK